MLKGIFSRNNINNQVKDDRLHSFKQRCQQVTESGYLTHPPPYGLGDEAKKLQNSRREYLKDYQFLIDSFSRLGRELQNYPGNLINPPHSSSPIPTYSHLGLPRRGVSQCTNEHHAWPIQYHQRSMFI